MSSPTPLKSNVIYISHGAGPLPVLGDGRHHEMVDNLKHLAGVMPRPKDIIVASAHWETDVPTITAGPAPELIYDYYGFPQESYELSYPAPGHPELARDMQSALAAKGIECVLDTERGFDHGLFIPLLLMYPEADIPCIQISLVKGLDPEQHLALGEALRAVDREGLLFIGSGFSFHNMRAFFQPPENSREPNTAFQSWLTGTLSDTNTDEASRRTALENWEQADGARFCHPREEHLLPLHVAYGFAGQPSSTFFEMKIFDQQASNFLWRSEE